MSEKEGFGFSNYRPEVEKRKYTRKRHYLPASLCLFPQSLSAHPWGGVLLKQDTGGGGDLVCVWNLEPTRTSSERRIGEK